MRYRIPIESALHFCEERLLSFLPPSRQRCQQASEISPHVFCIGCDVNTNPASVRDLPPRFNLANPAEKRFRLKSAGYRAPRFRLNIFRQFEPSVRVVCTGHTAFDDSGQKCRFHLLTLCVRRLSQFGWFHRPAIRCDGRQFGQPAANHWSMSTRRQRTSDRILTGLGHAPESAIRRTVRVEQFSNSANCSTSINSETGDRS